MRCSKCRKDASYHLYFYKNNGKIDFVEGRCPEHFDISNKAIRKDIKKVREMKRGKNVF